MKCPECNTEYAEMLSHCPNCGAPTPRKQRQTTNNKQQKNADNRQLQLGKGMMAFIVIGLLALIAFFTVQYMVHRNDPDYFRTLIDPDTTLADRDEVRFEQAPIDTVAAAKEEEEAKREAEKMYNSIRRQPVEEEPAADESSESTETTTDGAPATEAPTAPAEQQAPAPKVEAIE